MAHLLQVGAGSGGMVVLDLLAREERITHVTLIEPDVYKPHNVARHLFPASDVGEFKAELAADYLRARRPELTVAVQIVDLLDPAAQAGIETAAAQADVGVCAVDNEPAKYHWDRLMRRHAKPWTLGEVLSGGIGGFVHAFLPGGPCYGCVATYLKRAVVVDQPPAPDYSQPGGPIHETTVPAAAAPIHVIAALHAVLTLRLLDASPPDWTSLLMTLQHVPGVFDQAFRTHRLRIERLASCLVCGLAEDACSGAALDAALATALERLGTTS